MSDQLDIEKQAFLETDHYIYQNPLLRWLTNTGHKTCADMRLFDSTDSSVMELGCGTGSHFSYVQQAPIIGIDTMMEMLLQAKNRLQSKDNVILADISNLPFKDKSVISMVSFGVLEHISLLEKTILEIYRVLQDNGEFIFGIPCEGFLYRLAREFTTKRHVEKVTGIDYNKAIAKEHVNKCRDILKELRRYFRIEYLKGVPFVIPSIEVNFVLCGRCIKRYLYSPNNHFLSM